MEVTQGYSYHIKDEFFDIFPDIEYIQRKMEDELKK